MINLDDFDFEACYEKVVENSEHKLSSLHLFIRVSNYLKDKYEDYHGPRDQDEYTVTDAIRLVIWGMMPEKERHIEHFQLFDITTATMSWTVGTGKSLK